MVAIALHKVALLVATTVGVMVSARGSYYPDDSLAARGIYLDDELDYAVRDFDDEPLSVREYIDEQIEIAVRAYADEFQQLYARHSDAEIKRQVKYWKEQVAASEKLLPPLVKARKEAEKKYNKDKSAENKKAYDKAKLAEDKQRDIVEGNREQLEYWEKEKPSRPGTPEKPQPKKKPGVK